VKKNCRNPVHSGKTRSPRILRSLRHRCSVPARPTQPTSIGALLQRAGTRAVFIRAAHLACRSTDRAYRHADPYYPRTRAYAWERKTRHSAACTTYSHRAPDLTRADFGIRTMLLTARRNTIQRACIELPTALPRSLPRTSPPHLSPAPPPCTPLLAARLSLSHEPRRRHRTVLAACRLHGLRLLHFIVLYIRFGVPFLA
jgi:hypothetical protein